MGISSSQNLLVRRSANQPVPIHIFLFGEVFVGKTCLARTYESGVFKENTNMRIGVSRHIRKLKVKNVNVNLFVWNVTAQERRHEPPHYCSYADGAFLVYDVANACSFRALHIWLERIRRVKPDTLIFIIGARSDLLDRKVTIEEAEAYSRSQNIEFFECSAKTGYNVNEIFEDMTLRILQKKGRIPSAETKIKIKYLDRIEKVTGEEKLCGSANETELLKFNQQDAILIDDEHLKTGHKEEQDDKMTLESSDKVSSANVSSDDKKDVLPKQDRSFEMLIEGNCPSFD